MKLGELEKYKNKQIAILGFWKEGKSTLNFLKDFWMQKITILDSNTDIVKEKNHK
jgi:UDP-N-acetylmuramoylalanine-D-glutamate ligase